MRGFGRDFFGLVEVYLDKSHQGFTVFTQGWGHKVCEETREKLGDKVGKKGTLIDTPFRGCGSTSLTRTRRYTLILELPPRADSTCIDSTLMMMVKLVELSMSSYLGTDAVVAELRKDSHSLRQHGNSSFAKRQEEVFTVLAVQHIETAFSGVENMART